MCDTLGQGIDGFARALAVFQDGLSAIPALHEAVFDHTEEWVDLLTYKLVPQLAGEGCLVVAVAGGTNTGKSTVFNMLLGREASPVRSTAAATCRPVFAGNAMRAKQAIEGRLFPDFHAMALEDLDSAISRDTDCSALFVVAHEELPDRLVLLDTPDVDSIDRENWDRADHIRATGDVLIAVVTAEKYKDDRIIAYYRAARAAGRIVLPLMNKANPAEDYATARSQLGDFCREVGLDNPPCFVVPHDFDVDTRYGDTIHSLEGDLPLWEYLESLDVAAIKTHVFRDTVSHFAHQAEDFLERTDQLAGMLRSVIHDFESRAEAMAGTYDPEPGTEVGRLLHDHIKARRGVLSRSVGRVSGMVAKGLAPVRALANRAMGRTGGAGAARRARTEEEIAECRERAVATGARNLAQGYSDSAHALQPPANVLVRDALNRLDADAAVRTVVDQTIESEGLSDRFRAHVERTLEDWWRDHAVKRQILMELDAILVVAPTAICVPLSFYSGGVGVPEVTAVAGILGGGFFEQVLLHQLSDRWLKLIGPWRDEQQRRFADALCTHITAPCLAGVHEALAPFENDAVETMRKSRELCLRAL